MRHLNTSCSGGRKDNISKFISNDTRAYIEIKEENKLQKIYTEYNERYTGILVFNESNNLEIIKIAFADNSKNQNVWTIELRQQKDSSPPGKKLVEKDYIETLNSSAPEFQNWKQRFSSFPTTEPSLTQNFVGVAKAPNDTSGGTKIVDGEAIALRIKDSFCFCRNFAGTPAIAGSFCTNSALRCAADNLCDVWECVESGEWTGSCSASLEQAKVCLGEYQE